MLRRSILCCNARRKRSYADLNGASTDSAHFNFAWRKSDEQLASADFPWIADNVIQHVTVNGLKVGRNPAKTLSILDALNCARATGKKAKRCSNSSLPDCQKILQWPHVEGRCHNIYIALKSLAKNLA